MSKQTRSKSTDYEGVSWTELTTLRATVLRVGGTKKPTVELKAGGEKAKITAQTNKSLARLMGKNLFEEVEVDLEITRERDNNIRSAEVKDVRELIRDNQFKRIVDWFSEPTLLAKVYSMLTFPGDKPSLEGSHAAEKR